MPADTLFTPLRLGAIELPHRILMAPLTQMRAGNDAVPTVSRQAKGSPNVPGIFTPRTERRVAVRLAPATRFNGMSDSNPAEIFGYAAKTLNRYTRAYRHIIEPRINGTSTAMRR